MSATPRDAVNLWAVGFAAAAVIQGVGPRRFARHAKWDYNDGWQREIAIWNIGTLTTIAALRRENADPDRSLIAGFGVLSALFGANHLAAALKSPRSWGNWLGAASNALGLATGLAALDDSRPGKPKPPA
ncbi:MAG TPA: hypothetical protein VE401_11125 [Solirubrobacterales bacterium]|jgi:uncharacterized membrane protein HdeD (DUF308 family)|nr:hypothetical protein [Solirubrobacterales bacterium]